MNALKTNVISEAKADLTELCKKTVSDQLLK